MSAGYDYPAHVLMLRGPRPEAWPMPISVSPGGVQDSTRKV